MKLACRRPSIVLALAVTAFAATPASARVADKWVVPVSGIESSGTPRVAGPTLARIDEQRQGVVIGAEGNSGNRLDTCHSPALRVIGIEFPR